MKLHSALTWMGAAALAMATAGCGKTQAPQQQQMPPPEVGVITVQATQVPLVQNLVGRLSPLRSADVRARVAGVLQKRVYTEGSEVKEGQVLFKIDPTPLRATLNAQLANLAAAQATYANNHAAAERARAVGEKGLLSKADIDAAIAAERTAAATVKQAQATVETAKINLGYADVTAPISGRSGQQQVTEGALVGQSEATLLTTVDQVDPLYVNFTQAVSTIDELRRSAAAGGVQLFDQNKAKIELLLPSGVPYGETGTLDFSDTTVDSATGAVTLRGIVPNPQHALLPGQYVNVRLSLGEHQHVWLIPQVALQRDAAGAYVLVVGPDGKVVEKRVHADTTHGADWVVTEGLADGDQVIASGIQRAKTGQPAKATPWTAPAAATAAATAASSGSKQ